MTDLESALALAYESGAPALVFACRLALMSATTLLGRAPAERRQLYEDAVGHAHEQGYVGGLLSALEVEQAIANGDFDRALRVSRLLAPDSVVSAEVGLRIALVDVARSGPEAMPDLDALRRRLLKGPLAWKSFAATSAQPLLLADDPGRAIEHAELAVKPLTEGSWRWSLDIMRPRRIVGSRSRCMAFRRQSNRENVRRAEPTAAYFSPSRGATSTALCASPS